MSQLTKNIGEISGKILVFGGIYSNYQSLEELRRIADEAQIPPQNIICTGDIVGYCASPSECIDFVEDWGIWAIQGNVEQNLINGTEDCGCNFEEGSRCDIFSKQWFPFAVMQMTERNLNFLAQLPERLTFEYAKQKIEVIHGSYEHISEFIFRSTDWAVKAHNFSKTNANVVLAGHCGLPFGQEKAGKYWLNAGVIGMPANDGTPRVWYLILDDADGQFSYKFHNYEYESFEANQLMLENGLPYSYSETLLTGIWDNNEILPDEETALQGIPIEF